MVGSPDPMFSMTLSLEDVLSCSSNPTHCTSRVLEAGDGLSKGSSPKPPAFLFCRELHLSSASWSHTAMLFKFSS